MTGIRVAALLLVLGVGTFVLFFRLGVPSWGVDELGYAHTGRQFVLEGNFSLIREHPPLVKEILGVAQAIGGPSTTAVRVPAAIAALLSGAVLFWFGQRAMGFWAGILAAGLWFILPHATSPLDPEIAQVKFDRYAMLDVFMAFFMILALYLGWRWIESGRWCSALLCGVAVGLAISSKAPGILVLPGIILFGLVLRRDWRSLWQAGALVLVAGVAALIPYAPLGQETDDTIRYMFGFQREHGRQGHIVLVAGTIYQHPPWWTHLWWQWESLGALGSLSIIAGLAAAATLGRRRLSAYILAAVIVPLAYFSLFAGVALNHYHFAWQAPLTLLVAIGVIELLRQSRWGLVLALVVALPLIFLGARTVMVVAQIEQSDYAAAAEILDEKGLSEGNVVVVGWPHLARAYLPKANLLKEPDDQFPDAVLIDSRFSSRFPRPDIDQYLKDHQLDFAYYMLDPLEVYVRR